MKRMLLAMLTLGGLGCAVDTAPQTAPTSDEQSTEQESMQTPAWDQPMPHIAQCVLGQVCEPRANCLAAGGQPGATCAFTDPVSVCCTRS